ncbi:class I SAM-dependent rRNA methyltransferase [Mammaliicoccus fleurettii]|uniref:class I SAM-dependent rRNA methyltransferase n=1 Tax=Mammaliicoccus fleurettii TaxID=150056 RepID=UPI000D1CDA9C|nr:class I SAM-dependent rRNA methyltransferase [Mammaliicoccus fleurettii]PTE34334.1 class I SAM-dependent rRNA methyltransferase [Mammaliicoccus fleurettii]
MKQLMLKRGKEDKYLRGFPLVEKDDVFDMPSTDEGELVALVDSGKRFIATAYYGEQNKGIGWVLSLDSTEKIDHNFFVNLFKTAKSEREYYDHVDGINAYRIFNAEGDGIGGLTIDYYDGHLLIQWYSVGIYRLKDRLLPAIKEVFEYKSIFEKRRFRGMETASDFVDGTAPGFPYVVEENHLYYNIDLDDGPMTGIFLDQKDVRKKLRDHYSEDKDVLNLFSYTGAFSVAASENANSTTSVDLANRARPLTEANFGLNAIDLNNNHIFIMDVFDYFKYALRHGLSYDVVVIDPPSFARHKKKTFSVQKNYPELIEGSLELLNEQGTLVLSTNSSAFPQKAFKKMINQTLDALDVDYIISDVMGLPKDFKSHPHYKPSKYLKVVFVQING